MGMGGKGNPQYTESKIRYAPYVEEHHQTLLDSVQALVQSTAADNPYEGYTDVEIESAFFGTGYLLSSFPSLYDMYGKFMAGLDLEVLFDEILEDSINGPVLDDNIAAQGVALQDDIETVQLPEFEAGMRDINAVNSSSFVIGKALIAASRTKALASYSANLRTKMLPVAEDRFAKHLEWNRSVIDAYSQILKLYISAKMDVDSHNLEVDSRRSVWALSMWKYDMDALGVLQHAVNERTDQHKNKVAGALGGALSGAAAGSMVMPGAGTAIGAAVGLVGGLFS